MMLGDTDITFIALALREVMGQYRGLKNDKLWQQDQYLWNRT
jgi:hypothetical protein